MRNLQWMFAACALAGLSAARAQTPVPPVPQPGPNKVTLSQGQTIAMAVAAMGRAANAPVAVDPALTGRVSGATAKLPLEAGLTVIAKENHAVWRKVYLADSEIPHLSDGGVDARRLKRLVEAASAAPRISVGVVDPATKQMTVTSRAAETSPAMQEWSKGRTAVYLLYVPTPGMAGQGGDGIFGGERPDFIKMSPQERQQWAKDNNATVITSNMSSDELQQALQNLPPDEQKNIQEKMANNKGNMVMVLKSHTDGGQ